MNLFEKEKIKYEQIEIPGELKVAVEKAVMSASGRSRKNPSAAALRYIGIAAAVAAAAFITGLNTSESFAKELQDVPVLGGIVKVLTFRSYEEQNENVNITVEIPELVTEEKAENISGSTAPAEESLGKAEAEPNRITDINAEIDKYMTDYVTEAQKRLDEYKQAFLETGGTQEEWDERNFQIQADYEIKCQNENYVSFAVYGQESWVSAYAVTYFYNIDLRTGEQAKLPDLLGEDYITVANESILRQMQSRMEENPDYTYWGEDMDGFTTISDETRFYINDKGNPVIVFDKYEVAPGFMGQQEFEIRKT